MITWREYYDIEMKKIEKSKIRCEKAFIFVILLYVIAQCFIGLMLI
jgi:hypothetical protein